MFTCYRVTSIEYYEKRQAEADRDAVREADGGDLQYYHDNGAGERPGRWWTTSGWSTRIAGAEDSTAIDIGVLRDLAQGVDPTTGDPLIQPTKTARTVGYDCQMAAPKSVSVLWAVASEIDRARIEHAHSEAVRATLEWAQAQGLIVTRRGSGGEIREPVRDVAAATYLHTTSRAGDPQLHTHAVLVNVCVRADGSTGTIDNLDILRYQGSLGAHYRLALASGLRTEFGWQAVKADRNFEIAGVPEAVVDIFSKRRAAIEEIAEARGYDTAAAREAAQIANLATRGAKDDLAPLEDLERSWHAQLAAAGHQYDAIWDGAFRASLNLHPSRPSFLPDESVEERQDRILLLAFESLLATSTVIEERHLLQAAYEALQCEADPASAAGAIQRLQDSGTLLELGRHEGRPCYTTQAMVDLEVGMVAAASARRNAREFIAPAVVESALARRPTMSVEQMDAVRHALNTDGVAVVEGYAGAGKSFSSGAIAEAAREAGLQVQTIAPSWKATEVVRSDTETAEEMARAVAKFLHEVKDGRRGIASGSVVILDEGGMVGLREMAELVRITAEADAKLVVAGDTRQLKPVAAGAPMDVLRQQLGSTAITEIRRQQEGWMRQASTLLATGKVEQAVDTYDKAGKVAWIAGRDETLAALARDWSADVAQRPDETRIVLARRNADVARLNELLRAEYASQGRLGGDAVVVQAVGRSKGGSVADLELRAGDRILFGENVSVRGQRISNADLATVVGISAGADPVLRVRLDKGGEVAARITEFAGWREKGEAPIPRLQHAYATTIHAAQGATVDRVYLAESGGMGRESIYVGLTRHRWDARLYVETSRIEDILASRKGVSVTAGRNGASIPDAGDADTYATTLHDVKRYAVASWSNSETKRNVSDFAKLELSRKEAAVAMLEHLRQGRHAVLDRGRSEAPRIAMERVPVPPVSARPAPLLPPRAGQDREDGGARARIAAAHARGREKAEAGIVPPRQSLRVTDDEVAAFLKTDLAQFAQAHGYRIDGSYSHRGETGRDPVKLDGRSQLGWRLVAPNGDKLTVAPGAKHDLFFNWSRQGQEGWSGNVLSFTRAELGLRKPGENLHYLRQQFGTGPATSTAEPRFRERTEQASTQAQANPERARATWSKMEPGHRNRYLIEERGLSPEILDLCKASIRTEPERWEKSRNRGGVAFAHYDEQGRICGYERKGPSIQSEGKRAFSEFVADGIKTLALHGDTRAPSIVVVAENSIDGLSYAQHAGLRGRVLVVSTCGSPSANALDLLARKSAEFRGARFEIARDADDGGDTWTARVETAVRRGAPDAQIAVRAPGTRFKDWNNAIRGLARADELSRNKAKLEASPSSPSPSPPRTKPDDEPKKAPVISI